jgi:hypothetical protein
LKFECSLGFGAWDLGFPLGELGIWDFYFDVARKIRKPKCDYEDLTTG